MLLSRARFQPRFWAGEWGASARLDVENKGDAGFGPDFGRTLPPSPEAIPGTDCAALRYETKSPRPAPGLMLKQQGSA